MRTPQAGKSGIFLFAAGMAAGLAAAALAAGLALTSLQRRGMEIQVQTGVIASQVKSEIHQTVRRELPRAVEQLKAELPEVLAREAAEQLARTRLRVGTLQVPVPPGAAEQLRGPLEEALRRSVESAVRQADLDTMAARLSNHAFAVVQARLEAALDGQTFVVRPVPWIAIPVRVRPV